MRYGGRYGGGEVLERCDGDMVQWRCRVLWVQVM